MERNFPGGVWPVMLTPFKENAIDYKALEELIEWYIRNNVSGLFSVCQSSEMFFLTDEEATNLAAFITKKVNGRIPVIASGHTADTIEKQAKQVKNMYSTGVDAVILITNRLANEEENDTTFETNVNQLLDLIPSHIPLGFYECPVPYKRLIQPGILRRLAQTGRFYFLKDTCCDQQQIEGKINAVEGTALRIYNANTATLLDTLKAGVFGYSGVMANFQPDLYAWLVNNYEKEPIRAKELQNFLSMSALIERQHYPANAKYYLQTLGLSWLEDTRVNANQVLNSTEKTEVRQLKELTNEYRKRLEKWIV
ncbi:4-hydroxy-tetrahydrodipicolinate synthase [Alkalihalobacillus xiaoxiensis]|uniref:4-hydroxy-tetrahydrodipicolinate synthase n=1 Tax=Shouchella xiaoxiensis TaxID=766895 RepID=A0ABS2T2L9_9BACI|nr:dihydrodipicolinate synthase family protein [Shouchella xiaoxiensis]MBM7840939.1 4-hydroxy-tetrahydrodipicolinate synthase [Shouchella xiaoxiensis]